MTDLKKPITRVVRGAGIGVHGVSDDLVVTLSPSGFVSIREPRRKVSYSAALSDILTRAILADVDSRKRKTRLVKRGLLRKS
jgi:hypothetical protein